MALKLYSKDTLPRFDVSPSSGDRLSEQLMGESVLNLSFTLFAPYEVHVGDYVEFQGRRFSALERYRPSKISRMEYRYQLALYDEAGVMRHTKVLKPRSEHQELVFSYDARPEEHIRLIVDNANRITPGWVVGTVIAGSSQNIEYANKYCLESLADIAEAYDTEWWIEGKTINLCRREHGAALELGRLEGLLSLEATQSNNKYYTRLYPLGSSRNIDPRKYGASRLLLPGKASYIERNTHLGIIEESEEAAFAHIYPRYTGTVTAVRKEQRRIDDKAFDVYFIQDTGLPFSPSEYEIAGLVKHVVFQAGELNGRDFEANYLPSTKEWELIAQHPYDNQTIPGGRLIPKVGDKYIPYNFRMPDEYIARAEEELKQAAETLLGKLSVDTTIYRAQTDYTYLIEHGIDLGVGQRVTLVDNELFAASGGRHTTRITALSRSVLEPALMDIELSYSVERGRLAQIETGIDKMRAAYRSVEATLPAILRSWDSTDPSEDNVMSSARTIGAIQALALPRDRDARTAYSIGSKDHAPGSTGWLLTPEGDLDLRNLAVSGILQVDELRKNRISIQEGETYFSAASGVVESVAPGTFTVRGEAGDRASFVAGDIVIGKWATATSTEVCKLRVSAVSGRSVSYELAPGSSVHPRVGMHLAQMGHKSDKRRQRATVVRGNNIVQYAGVDGWEIGPQHITAVLGDLESFSFAPFGDLRGSGVYLANAYISGTIVQRSADGSTARLLPFYKGPWATSVVAHMGDQYLHKGHRWTWTGVAPTNTTPGSDVGWRDDGEEPAALIEGLEIGGRNLVLKSNVVRRGTSYHLGRWDLSELWIPNQVYTLSLRIGINRKTFESGGKEHPVTIPVHGRMSGVRFCALEPLSWSDTPDSEGLYWATFRGSFAPSEAYLSAGNEPLISMHLGLSRANYWVYKVEWVKLERGNKATDYSPAPEDASAEAKAKADAALAAAKSYTDTKEASITRGISEQLALNDYLRRAIAKGSTQSAGQLDTGVVLTEVLATKDSSGLVRAFLSGDPAYPAFAAGVDNFGAAEQTQRVVITHQGDVILGQMRMAGEAGVISFMPMAGGTPYLTVGGAPTPLKDILEGRFSNTDRQSPKVNKTYEGAPKDETIVLIDNYYPDDHDSGIIVSGVITAYAESSYNEDDTIEVLGNPTMSSMATATAAISIYHISESGERTRVSSPNGVSSRSYFELTPISGAPNKHSDGLVSKSINIKVTTYGRRGRYQLVLELSHWGRDTYFAQSQFTAQFAMTQETAVYREIHLSDQALYAIFGTKHFLHVDREAITMHHKVEIIGDTNIPGVLASGTVSDLAVISAPFGAKVNEVGKSAPRAELLPDGSYKVYHSIGHTHYSVQLTAMGTHRYYLRVLVLASNYFTCVLSIDNDQQRLRSSFSYCCIGSNQAL